MRDTPGAGDFDNLRVLVAAAPRSQARIARVLAPCEVEFVTDAVGAGAALQARAFDLVVVGIYVQESMALDVLGTVKRLAPAVPVVCVRAAAPRSPMRDGTLEAFGIASAQLGAEGVVDFLAFPDDGAGDAAVRAEIDLLVRRRAG